jgi:hypothetical protein
LALSLIAPDEPPITRDSPVPPRQERGIAQGIAWMLLFKAAALTLIYVVGFAPEHRPVTPERLADVLLSRPSESVEPPAR